MLRFKKILFATIPIISFLLALGFSICPSFGAPNAAMTAIWLTVSVFSLCFAWPDIVKSINFLGSSIQLREINDSIDKVKLLAEANSRAILELIQTQGKFGGVPDSEKANIYNEITKVLDQIGFDKTEISKIQERWHYWVEGDYVRYILGHHIPNNLTLEQKEKWDTVVSSHKQQDNLPSVEKLHSIMKEFNIPAERYQPFLDDYAYYKEHKTHLSIERWNNRQNWEYEIYK